MKLSLEKRVKTCKNICSHNLLIISFFYSLMITYHSHMGQSRTQSTSNLDMQTWGCHTERKQGYIWRK